MRRTKGMNESDLFAWMLSNCTEHGDCLLWNGYRNPSGYGRIKIGRKLELTHRFSFRMTNQDFDQSLFVCHKCDNPPCCNPEHLFIGTHRQNMLDRDAKGRQARLRGENHPGCKLSDEEVKEIRALIETGVLTQDRLGQLYGVSGTQIHLIKVGKSRADLSQVISKQML